MVDMTPNQIDELLNDARIGRLCMAHPDGQPYAIPLPFCWLEGALYVRLPLTGRKGEVLVANNRVCFETDACSDTLDDYASVLIEGRLDPVTDADERLRVKAANDTKYDRLRGGHRPGHGRFRPVSELPLRKILVERLSGKMKEPPPARASRPCQVNEPAKMTAAGDTI